MVAASALFALMGLCVKLASVHYPAPDLVLYRSLIGATIVTLLVRGRGGTLRTQVPMMHLWRAVLGVTGLGLWFYALTGLPLGTAMTLNSMSSVWLALFVVGGGLLFAREGSPASAGLVLTVMAGFAGVALVLRPTIDQQQIWFGLAGLLSGMVAALAYLHVAALGRAGEPEERIVFYFSVGGIVLGAGLVAVQGGPAPHNTWAGLGLVLAVGVLATTAQLLMTRAWAIGHPLVNAALQYLGIAFSVALGVWILDDPLHASTLLGMALIVAAGITATQVRSKAPTVTGPSDT